MHHFGPAQYLPNSTYSSCRGASFARGARSAPAYQIVNNLEIVPPRLLRATNWFLKLVLYNLFSRNSITITANGTILKPEIL
jgi:hypothetical protein